MKAWSIAAISSRLNRRQVIAVYCLIAMVSAGARASDWPQFLGPTRNAVYAGPPLAEEWPASGPPVVWTAEVGEGYSSPVVGEGRLVICHRTGDDLVVDCLDPKSGAKHWRFTHAMKFTDGAGYDSGPRATPAIKDGRVFVHNTDGYLVCLDLQDGREVWSRHAKSEFKSSATWHGCVASPLVTDKAVILPVGGSNSAVVAFARDTGDTLWQAFNEKASASSPVLAMLDGKPQLVVVTRTNLHGMDPDTGAGYWEFPTRKQTSGNVYAASPVVFGDSVFLTGWYELGALWLRVKNGVAEKVWHRDDVLSSHYATPILHEGHVYGFHGHAWERGGPSLRCVELATGKVAWELPQLGSGTLLRAGDNLLVFTDRGELLLAKASPKEFKIQCRAQVTARVARSYPAIADGCVFVKGPRKLVCLDLRAKSGY
jgi:outer membrane protein assembly factor BamB